jgi:hypothetical protein
VVDAVGRMTDVQQRCGFQKRVSELSNRAVFEIPEILERILETEGC